MKLLCSVHIWLRLVLIGLISAFVFNSPPGVLLSHSNSTPWEQVGLADDNVTGVVVPASNGAIAYASTSGYGHGIFRTDDQGNTWEPKITGLDVLDFRTLLLGDPQTDNLVYAMAALSLWKTVNRGESWVKVQLPWPSSLDNDCAHALYRVASNRHLYASMYQVWHGTYIFCQWSKLWLTKSLNIGTSWSDVSVPTVARSAIAISPSNVAIVYGADQSTIVWTQDGGETWEPRASVGRSYKIKTLTVDPWDPCTVYATTNKNGVYKTSNCGQSWNSLNQTLPTQGADLQCPSLAIHPTQPGVVFLACNSFGVYWSTDGGTTWTPRNEGFNPFLQVNSLAIAPLTAQSPSPAVVYMGTEAGVWRLVESNIPEAEFNIFLPAVFKKSTMF